MYCCKTPPFPKYHLVENAAWARPGSRLFMFLTALCSLLLCCCTQGGNSPGQHMRTPRQSSGSAQRELHRLHFPPLPPPATAPAAPPPVSPPTPGKWVGLPVASIYLPTDRRRILRCLAVHTSRSQRTQCFRGLPSSKKRDAVIAELPRFCGIYLALLLHCWVSNPVLGILLLD